MKSSHIPILVLGALTALAVAVAVVEFVLYLWMGRPS